MAVGGVAGENGIISQLYPVCFALSFQASGKRYRRCLGRNGLHGEDRGRARIAVSYYYMTTEKANHDNDFLYVRQFE